MIDFFAKYFFSLMLKHEILSKKDMSITRFEFDVNCFSMFFFLLLESSLLGEGTTNLGEFCFPKIGRADIEGSKTNVAMNACSATQAKLCLWVVGEVILGWEVGSMMPPQKSQGPKSECGV